MDHATDSFAELTTLSGGGLAIATKSSSFGACHLNISVFKAAALVEGARPTAPGPQFRKQAQLQTAIVGKYSASVNPDYGHVTSCELSIASFYLAENLHRTS